MYLRATLGAMRGPALLASLVIPTILASSAAAQPLIVLDAGHGGTDPGAVGCSLEEADVVLDVTQRLQVLLEAAGVRIALTRTDDTYVGLSARAAFANARAAEGFFSVHSNANAGTPASGTETFVYPGAGTRTRALGQGIQDAMIAAWMLPDRGLKEADFAVLRETSMPAALGELAFTNRCDPDALLLGDPAARQTMAEHQRDAILEWLGIDPTTTTGTLQGVVFEDQGVGAEDITVRLDGATVRIVETGAMATVAAPRRGVLVRAPARRLHDRGCPRRARDGDPRLHGVGGDDGGLPDRSLRRGDRDGRGDPPRGRRGLDRDRRRPSVSVPAASRSRAAGARSARAPIAAGSGSRSRSSRSWRRGAVARSSRCSRSRAAPTIPGAPRRP